MFGSASVWQCLQGFLSSSTLWLPGLLGPNFKRPMLDVRQVSAQQPRRLSDKVYLVTQLDDFREVIGPHETYFVFSMVFSARARVKGAQCERKARECGQ